MKRRGTTGRGSRSWARTSSPKFAGSLRWWRSAPTSVRRWRAGDGGGRVNGFPTPWSIESRRMAASASWRSRITGGAPGTGGCARRHGSERRDGARTRCRTVRCCRQGLQRLWPVRCAHWPHFMIGPAAERKGVSNCLKSQAEASTAASALTRHVVFVRTIVLRMVSNFRIHATSASFFGLPAASNRR